MRILYSFFFYLVLPLVVIRLCLLSFKNPRYLERLPQRFGFIPELAKNKKRIWLHAVSVGEVQATKPLITLLEKHYPNIEIVISTGTPTGAEMVRQLFADKYRHVYQPYDVPWVIKRVFKKLKPKLFIIMETELWPNMLHYCHIYNIPSVLVNGRLSERSARRYAWVLSLTKSLFQDLASIAVQSRADAERMIVLGADRTKVKVTGSIKFDMPLAENVIEKVELLKQRLFKNRPIWIAASTHEGEEEMTLAVHEQLLKTIPNCLLILAPRHPVRVANVIPLIEQKQFRYILRTEHEVKDKSALQVREALDIEKEEDESEERRREQVFVLDTLGELLLFYAIADVVFVAGSLVPHGGHNPIEPASLSKPVLIGPYDRNFMQISRQLIERGGAYRVEDVEQLTAKLQLLFADADSSQEMGQRALDFVEISRGASKQVLDILSQFLE